VARSILASLFLLHGAIGDRVSNAVACIIALISTRSLLAVVTVTVAFALLREATDGESRQGAVLSETLLRTGSSWDGEPYKSYLSGQPELTILKITLAPHTKLEWHSHPMPNAAYILSGELTLERKRDGKKQHFAAGQAVSETVDTPHRGITGDEPVIVIVFYAGIAGTPLNSPAPLHQCRVGEPYDIAQAYLFLMQEGFGTGQTLVVDGGTVLV